MRRIEDDGPLVCRAEASGTISTGRHLGGPTDGHYAILAVQPIEAVEAWSVHWPPHVAYHLGEAALAIARCGTKGQIVRDIRKAAWMLTRAADVLECKVEDPRKGGR